MCRLHKDTSQLSMTVRIAADGMITARSPSDFRHILFGSFSGKSTPL
jgi:hypothetical protein